MGRFFSRDTSGPGGGLFPQTETAVCIARLALDRGDIAAVDLTATDAAVDATDDDAFKATGLEGSALRNMRAVAANEVDGFGLLGVVLDVGGIADDDEGEFGFFGLFEKVFCIALSGNIIPGQGLVPIASSQDLDGVQAAEEQVVGIHMAPTLTAPTSHALSRVLFNGITGWGTSVA
jgi:hypothetical protein